MILGSLQCSPMWALVSLHHLLHLEWWGPSDLSDYHGSDKAVNTELLLLLNPWSGEGEGGWGCVGPWFLQCQSWSWPLCGLQGNGWWSKLASPECSFQRESPEWWDLNGWGVNGWECGHPGPLATIWHSVMAWAITHQPSCMVKGLAERYANLSTQVLAPVRVNMASLASPKLRPSPRDHLP